jgi:ketosteroid isomerase-like protein
VPETVGVQLVQAIANQDAQAIADCFSSDTQIRALTPPGIKEREGAADAAALIAAWFRDSTVLDLVDSRTGEVGGRLYVAYRFEGVEDGKPYVVEQHLYGTLSDGKIACADLLCSGFLPRLP